MQSAMETNAVLLIARQVKPLLHDNTHQLTWLPRIPLLMLMLLPMSKHIRKPTERPCCCLMRGSSPTGLVLPHTQPRPLRTSPHPWPWAPCILPGCRLLLRPVLSPWHLQPS
jgi:hypothetical protein